MRTFIFIILLFVLLAGCASLGKTLEDIALDPVSFNKEVADSAGNVKDTVPELPFVISIGIGYLASFLRRWYKNTKIQQAKDSGKINP